jgi:hypothetical protein
MPVAQEAGRYFSGSGVGWFLSQFDGTFSLLTCPRLPSLPHRDSGYPALIYERRTFGDASAES